MAKRKQTVWVVMHYEFVGAEPCEYIDAVQFHVASSRRRAERHIRGRWVFPFSWWQVHPHALDYDGCEREGAIVYYYSHKGKPLARPPYKQAKNAWERDKIENPHLH
jgi:hypothetical protein